MKRRNPSVVVARHPSRTFRARWPLLLALTAFSPCLLAQAAAPDALATQMVQIRQLATSGQKKLAIQRYTALLAEHPGNGDLLLARGRTYAWDGQYAAAESDLHTVVQHSPDYADAWSALGDVYRWSGRPQEAVDAYSHWVKLAPRDPKAYIARGSAQRDMGQLAAARADFDTAATLGANPAEIDGLRQSLLPRTTAFGTGYDWGASLSWDHTGFTGGQQGWNDVDLSLRRYFSQGSLALELLRADHFGTSDTAWALDGYVPLWSRAYANLRYQQGPGSGILPQQEWRAEVFQGVGRGWELSASVDHLHFSSNTQFYGVGVGRYWGDWYARYKLQYVPGVGSGSWSNRFLLRNYYRGNAFDYLELSVGNGRSTDLNRYGTQVFNNHAAIGVAWSHYLSPRWGFKLSAGYGEGSDVAGVNEQILSATLYALW
ncbi:MAG: YaiO family outer membrane beta-barrel protein [Xanthomonadaceae bacterium]|jgi:YaiO family outer membrane protein|nr:YaiO family outer membrane beta-barrel protein [Xanthomonadaceae bacterium]MDE3071155.1 YaiO family outer membrane beta-barrel protein [Pseudomonadota bacterium]